MLNRKSKLETSQTQKEPSSVNICNSASASQDGFRSFPDGKSKVPATTAPFGTAPPTNADDATSFGFAARLRQIFGQKKTTCLLAKTLLESLAIALVCIGPIVLFLFTDHVEDFLGSVPGILRQRHLWDADSNSGSTEDAGFASWWTLPTCVVVFVVYSAYLRSGRADFVAKVNEGVKLD